MKRERLRFEKVTCVQGGVTVLNNLDFYIFEGEILGVIFLDEQGKQPLVDMILRNEPLHYGRIYLNGRMVNSYLHSDNTKNPATLISNKNPLIHKMTVADNVFVIRGGFKKYLIQPKVLNSQLAAFAKEAGVQLNGFEYVENLTVYQQCVVQLLKAVILGHKLVIIQDISNLISQADLKKYHQLMRHFAAQGVSFAYICSHHEEIYTVCNRAVVIENGATQKNILKADLNTLDKGYFERYVLQMAKMRQAAPPQQHTPQVVGFSNVSYGHLQNASFSIGRGECVALLDVNNTALEDIFALLGGRAQPNSGQMLLAGKPYPKHPQKTAPRVGLVQKEPIRSMLHPGFTYLDNLCFLAGQKRARLWHTGTMRKNVRQEYLPLIGQHIDAQSIQGLPPASLYNLVYYSQHLFNPALVVAMQPFLGADMYLRQNILYLLNQLLKKGISILLLSVNLSDSLVIANRMLTMENGRITKEYHRAELDTLKKG